METEDLLVHALDTHSQNGEDGIIAAIFDRIGTTTRACCEFGAWDGVHLSNCRNLILLGWSALMIEGDERRFEKLQANYETNPLVTCVNQFVDAGNNTLGSILERRNLGDLDFLSIDIDGLDYEILETLDVRPRVICVEVNAGHDPESETKLGREVARNNVGQPLEVFVKIAGARGYDLVCYTGNAFFVRRDLVRQASLPVLSSKDAYRRFLSHLPAPGREWLYLVNLGIVDPFFQFGNCRLARQELGIRRPRAMWLQSRRTIVDGAHAMARRLARAARG